jgi:hypothetical protein
MQRSPITAQLLPNPFPCVPIAGYPTNYTEKKHLLLSRQPLFAAIIKLDIVAGIWPNNGESVKAQFLLFSAAKGAIARKIPQKVLGKAQMPAVT